jgi:hypothetical protein
MSDHTTEPFDLRAYRHLVIEWDDPIALALIDVALAAHDVAGPEHERLFAALARFDLAGKAVL